MDSKATADRIQHQVSNYLADFSGQADPHTEVLSGKRSDSPVLKGLMSKIQSGQAEIHDLGRGYKHTPHAPPALLYKYIVHRVNNLENYDSRATGSAMDESFFAENGRGEAREQHKLVTARHLNHWLAQNPKLVPQALEVRDQLHASAKRGIGLNVRKINGEPYVAVARGLFDHRMRNEMALSSFSDTPDTGFGAFQHRAWVPLKDLWYGFPAAPSEAGGDHGHENEWLFSNQGQRFEAQPHEVKPSFFSTSFAGELPLQYAPLAHDDDAMAVAIAERRVSPQAAIALSNAKLLGPKTLQAATAMGLDPTEAISDPLTPRNVAMESFRKDPYGNSAAISNPNLTEEDLMEGLTALPNISKAHMPLVQREVVGRIAGHNATTEKVLAGLVESAVAHGKVGQWLPIIAKQAKLPSMALHRTLIEGLDQAHTWMPSKVVADSFHVPEWGMDPSPAFNNSQNAERYLKALAFYFRDDTDEPMARDAYHKMLTGARMDDSLLSTLVDLGRSGRSLSGISNADHNDILGEVARFNRFLTPRQQVLLARIPQGAYGLALRKTELAPHVQREIIDNASFDFDPSANSDWGPALRGMAASRSLDPAVADIILKRSSTAQYGYTQYQLAYELASNPDIPEDIIKKHIQNKADPNLFEKALVSGLDARRFSGGPEHMLKPLPVGGVE